LTTVLFSDGSRILRIGSQRCHTVRARPLGRGGPANATHSSSFTCHRARPADLEGPYGVRTGFPVRGVLEACESEFRGGPRSTGRASAENSAGPSPSFW
jgi:hypothetical protein